MSDKNADQEDQQMEEKRLPFYLSDNELLCKTGCGFYGTPQTKGLCSRCWRNYQLEDKRLSDYNRNRELLRQETAELLRKSSDVRHTFRTLLKKSPSVFAQDTSSPTGASPSGVVFAGSGPRPSSPESSDALAHFQNFLTQNFTPANAKELEKQCRNFFDTQLKDEMVPIDELSNTVQNFYQTMKDRIVKLNPLPEAPLLSQFMTELETFICVCGYHLLFGSRTEEEAEDLSLQSRIRSLNWVTSGFLDTTLDESSNQVQEYINEAITEIIDLNSHRSVIKKMDCLVRCSKNIFEALKESRLGAPASADEFLPVLILIVLKANPPLIQSNLKFISRFGLPSRNTRGEYGYYYTNLSSAIYFIQDMKASSLQLSEEDFEAYTSGKRVPPSARSAISTYVMRSIGNSLKLLDGLLERQDELAKKMDQLEQKIDSDCAQFKQQVNAFVQEEVPEAIKNIIEENSQMSNQNETQ